MRHFYTDIFLLEPIWLELEATYHDAIFVRIPLEEELQKKLEEGTKLTVLVCHEGKIYSYTATVRNGNVEFFTHVVGMVYVLDGEYDVTVTEEEVLLEKKPETP